MKVMKRTFEASQHPAGSAASTQLNLSPVTSQYLPALKYVLVEDDGTPTRWMFRTRKEAEDKMKGLLGLGKPITVLVWRHNGTVPQFHPKRPVLS